MTGTKYIQRMVEVELLVGDLYEYFAVKFRELERAEEFWSRLAGEEKKHAAILTEALPDAVTDQLSELAPEDPLHLTAAQNELQRMLETSRSKPLTIQAAISLAFGIEFSLAEKHVLIRSASSHPRWSELISELIVADVAHVERIRQFGREHDVYLPDERPPE